jgi:hypothetical protein
MPEKFDENISNQSKKRHFNGLGPDTKSQRQTHGRKDGKDVPQICVTMSSINFCHKQMVLTFEITTTILLFLHFESPDTKNVCWAQKVCLIIVTSFATFLL